MNHKNVLVIFGATGDLVAKKIIPALADLHHKNQLPNNLSILAFARRDLSTADYHKHIESLLGKKPNKDFLNLFEYQRGTFESAEAFKTLSQKLDSYSGRLFYLAVPPELNIPIIRELKAAGLNTSPKNGWTRIIAEKPIGISSASANEIEQVLCANFDETQIYRIDHYLAKEMVQNILRFRFSNSLFEESWNAKFIESIHIRLWETLGVEKRGRFYNRIGALRDVGQNHILQMLAFVTMDHPRNFEAKTIRQKRAEVLNTLHIPAPDELAETSARAQYENYRSIEGVTPDSKTETYFKLQAKLTTPRWDGVRIVMESGKRMAEQRKDITITFRTPPECLCPADSDEHLKNVIIFELEPVERIFLQLWTKKHGLSQEMEKRSLEMVLRHQTDRVQYVEEYEKLLLDCLDSDQTLFVDHNEIQAMWRYIDPIITGWEQNLAPLNFYRPDTIPKI